MYPDAEMQQEKRLPSWKDGLYSLLICAVLYLLAGFVMTEKVSHALIDFEGPFCGSRCLLNYADPYRLGTIGRMYGSEGRSAIPN